MAEPLSGAGLRIGIVCSRFNEEIVDKLTARADEELAALGVRAEDVTRASVAGGSTGRVCASASSRAATTRRSERACSSASPRSSSGSE